MSVEYSNRTDLDSHPHRCRYCEYADKLSGKENVYSCRKTGRMVNGAQIPECYACVFYSEVKR